MDEDNQTKIKRFKWQKERLAKDALEEWIREYAEKITDPAKRSQLIALANERKANTQKSLETIEFEIAKFEGASQTLLYFQTEDAAAGEAAKEMLPEGRTYHIDGKWSVRADKAHAPGMQNHNHILLRDTDVAVVNVDGSPSHNSDLSKIPNHIFAWIKDKGLTESHLSASSISEGVPAEVIAKAIQHESTVSRAAQALSKFNALYSS